MLFPSIIAEQTNKKKKSCILARCPCVVYVFISYFTAFFTGYLSSTKKSALILLLNLIVLLFLCVYYFCYVDKIVLWGIDSFGKDGIENTNYHATETIPICFRQTGKEIVSEMFFLIS